MSMLQCDIARNLHKRSLYMYKEREGKEKHGKERGTNGQERKRSRKVRKGVCRNRNGQARERTGRQGKELVCASFCSTLAQRHKDELTLLFITVIVKFPLVRYTNTRTYKFADCLVRTQNGSGSVMTPSLMKVSSLYREDYCAHDRIVIRCVSTR